jgi:glyceraldehyde 3-phosphate dehydrogenase
VIVTKEEINNAFKEASKTNLKGMMAYTDDLIVSMHIIGEPCSSVVDGLSTMVLGNKSNVIKILSWYDNEWSFVYRLIDFVKFIRKSKYH